jgi:hypothetical protein
LRKEQALADLRQFEVQAKRGEVASVAVLNSFMAGQILKARDSLMRLGPELCDRLAAASSPVTCQQMIDEEIRRALSGLVLFGKKWHEAFAGDGRGSEELRRLVSRMLELVDRTDIVG